MPLPPPVTTTVLPFAESSGRLGARDGYVVVCQVAVGEGNGAAAITKDEPVMKRRNTRQPSWLRAMAKIRLI